ncbi:hypothetical protein ACFL3C_02620 [Patescibacteria group bacterium]
MELSILVAKLYGAVCLALGLGLLFNAGYYKKAFGDMLKSKAYVFMGGAFALVVGLLLVMYHNVWEWQWYVIITIIGWIALVKGVLLLVFPKFANMFDSWFKNNSFLMVMGVGSLILGGVLTYFGWFA